MYTYLNGYVHSFGRQQGLPQLCRYTVHLAVHQHEMNVSIAQVGDVRQSLQVRLAGQSARDDARAIEIGLAGAGFDVGFGANIFGFIIGIGCRKEDGDE